jgi:thiamine-monophosphate kinase
MLDLSDGLSSDIGHICKSSQVGVRLDAAQLPIAPATHALADAAGLPAWELALSGGEDYELCCTLNPESAAVLIRELAAIEVPFSIVGEILPPEAGRQLRLPSGAESALDAAGWQHFGER